MRSQRRTGARPEVMDARRVGARFTGRLRGPLRRLPGGAMQRSEVDRLRTLKPAWR